MPLRDHFHPPLSERRSWEGFHGQWPAMVVIDLAQRLPRHYIAEPQVHLGSSVGIDVAAYEYEAGGGEPSSPGGARENGGGVTTALWAVPSPALSVVTDLPAQDAYEVRVYDTRSGRRLVAAVEIVSPSNKDRPEHRRLFVAKCAALLQNGVSIAIVDLVSTRSSNLYGKLMAFLGETDPSLGEVPPGIYAVACRSIKREDGWHLESWTHPLAIGMPLPTLPLWLEEGLAVPLELEASYEETCRVLRIA